MLDHMKCSSSFDTTVDTASGLQFDVRHFSIHVFCIWELLLCLNRYWIYMREQYTY